MSSLYDKLFTYQDYSWLQFVIIPIIAGLVGYGTNVVALWMTFYPIEFIGINLFRIKDEPWALFGWQGIIPTKTEKMAKLSFDLFTQKLFNIRDIFTRIDPVRFSEVMSDSTLLLMDNVITQVANQYMPNVWQNLPKNVKDDIIVAAEQEGHEFLSEFMKDMQDHLDDILDVKHLCVSACVANKTLVVQIFQECGDKEFIFIRRSGLYFGFIFGLFQTALCYLYPVGWVLPVAGFLVGWATNWIALKCIFTPLLPTKVGCWTFQGLFLKRQHEVSAIYSRVVLSEIVNVKALWDEILYGRLSKNFYAILRAHTIVFTEKLVLEIKPFAVAAMGASQFALMKEDIAKQVIDNIPNIIDSSYEYTQEALDMENMVRTKMQALSPEDFEGVL